METTSEVVPNYWTTGLDRVWLQFGRDLTLRIKGVIRGQTAQAAQRISQGEGRDRGRPRTEDDQPASESTWGSFNSNSSVEASRGRRPGFIYEHISMDR